MSINCNPSAFCTFSSYLRSCGFHGSYLNNKALVESVVSSNKDNFEVEGFVTPYNPIQECFIAVRIFTRIFSAPSIAEQTELNFQLGFCKFLQ